CEDQVLARSSRDGVEAKFALAELNLFKGLDGNELRKLERIIHPLLFEKDEVIIREGDEAKLFLFWRGEASACRSGFPIMMAASAKREWPPSDQVSHSVKWRCSMAGSVPRISWLMNA